MKARAILALCLALSAFAGIALPLDATPATLAMMSDGERAGADMQAHVPIAASCALWAHATSGTALSVSSARQRIDGCARSNAAAAIVGSGHSFTRTLRYATTLQMSQGGTNFEAGAIQVPPEINPYAPSKANIVQRAAAHGVLHEHADGVRLTSAHLVPGVHTISGNGNVDLRGQHAHVTIFATGTLTLDLDDATLAPYADGWSVVADDLRISITTSTLSGGAHASRDLDLNMHHGRLVGQGVAATINVRGNDGTFVAAPALTFHSEL